MSAESESRQIRLTPRPRANIRLTPRGAPIKLTPRMQAEPERSSEVRFTGFWGSAEPIVVDGLTKTIGALNDDGANAAVQVVNDEPGQSPGEVRFHVTGIDTLDVPIRYLVDMEIKVAALPHPDSTE